MVLTIHIAGDERVHISREFTSAVWAARRSWTQSKPEGDRQQKPESIYIDPSAAACIDDLLMHGFPRGESDQRHQTGIQQVTSALPRLTVDPSCVHTIAEFGPTNTRTKARHVRQTDQTERSLPCGGNND